MHHTMLWHNLRMRIVRFHQFFAIALFVTACHTNLVPLPTATPFTPATNTPPTSPTAEPTASATPTATPAYPWTDASAVMGGICFESVYDAAGQTFVIRSADELRRFFDLADGSGLCRLPVRRAEFDFGSETILAGVWSKGIGCDARHEVGTIQRDDESQRLTVYLTFVTEGDCPYELVQPFWVALEGMPTYAVEFIIEQ